MKGWIALLDRFGVLIDAEMARALTPRECAEYACLDAITDAKVFADDRKMGFGPRGVRLPQCGQRA